MSSFVVRYSYFYKAFDCNIILSKKTLVHIRFVLFGRMVTAISLNVSEQPPPKVLATVNIDCFLNTRWRLQLDCNK